MLRIFLACLLTLAFGVAPMAAASASAPCDPAMGMSMSASATTSPAPDPCCDHKADKSCAQFCAAMSVAVVGVEAPVLATDLYPARAVFAPGAAPGRPSFDPQALDPPPRRA